MYSSANIIGKNIAYRQYLFYFLYLSLKDLLAVQFKKQKVTFGVAPIVIIFAWLVGISFVAWALGQTLCWATVKKSFVFSVKIKTGYFKLGCQ